MIEIPEKLEIEYYRRELEDRDCRPVTLEDIPTLQPLIDHMIALTMSLNGSGLSAPQVGLYVRLAVVMPTPEKAHVLINPEITGFGGRDLIAEEGCLSIPPGTARVTRSEIVHLTTGTLRNPEAAERTVHKGREARIIQRQIDLLNGIFFINRVSALQRSMVLGKYSKWRRQQRTGGD
jgi:peptide deformylase